MGRMSPKGRLPARVYWIRRGILLAAVAVVIVVVGTGLSALGGSSAKAPVRAQTAAQTTGQTTGHTTGHTTGAASAPPSAGPSASRTNVPVGTCNPADIVATPVVRRAVGGGPVSIKVKLTGTATACAWKVSPQSLVVRITSGSDRIWSSQDCASAIPSQDVVVPGSGSANVVVTWSGQRSSTGCPKGTAWANPGYYHVAASTLGGVPTDVQFSLAAPTRAVVTQLAHPKPVKRTPAPQTSSTPSPSPSPTGSATPGH